MSTAPPRLTPRVGGNGVVAVAKAGDGGTRSEKRRLTATITIRVTDREKQEFEESARRCGFQSLAAWALDRMRSVSDAGLRERRVSAARRRIEHRMGWPQDPGRFDGQLSMPACHLGAECGLKEL